jgi:tetratricopeptide (TPR) repeat protein
MMRCSARVVTSVFAFCLLCLQANAAPADAEFLKPYAEATKECHAVLEKAVALVSQGQWRSAYLALDDFDKDNSDPFVLAMKTSIVLRGAVRSDLHRAFGLADLQGGQSLESLRQGSGDYAQIPLDPPALAKAQAAKGLSAPGILSKELGDYYADVLARFSGQWTIGDDEILALIADEYAKAYAAGVYDGASLMAYAESLMRLKRADESEPIYKRAVEIDPGNAELRYSYAMSLIARGKKLESLPEIDAAVAAIVEPSTKIDALALGARVATELGDTTKADSYFEIVDKAYPDGPTGGLLRHAVYIEAGKKEAAAAIADSILAAYRSSPNAPAIIRTIVTEWYAAGEAGDARDFLQRNIAKSSDDQTVGTLNFYLAVLLTQDSPSDADKALALKALDEAEDHLKAAFGEENDVFGVIAGMRDSLKGIAGSGASGASEGK